ncbi:MAG: hypothetical protein KC656_27035 [Myxococcales bacterium]|nr:hypothetical protein [Myxococcales bacterium]
MRRVLLRTVVAPLLALGAAELTLRVLNPDPRRVMFRADVLHGLDTLDGLPIWRDVDGYDPPRPVVLEDQGCDRDGAFVVAVIGDSILNGVDLDPADVATVALKAKLDAAFPDERHCVVNLAVPGFSLLQGMARARALLDRAQIDVLVMELWAGAPRIPSRIGDTVYFFEGMTRDTLGHGNPWGLPASWNAALIDHSRLYEYAVLSAPQDCTSCRYDLGPFRAALDGLVDRVRAQGGEVVSVMPARLNHPFDAQPEPLFRETAPWEAWTTEQGIRNVRLWEAFAGIDPDDVALDSVHLNADGQAHLAGILFDLIAPIAAEADVRETP